MEDSFADIEEEYKKYPELKRDDVRILQEWMAKQPHLPKISELKIVIFLSGCCYNIEATKKCIEAYYTFRTHYPPIFQDRDITQQSFQDAIKATCMNTIKVDQSDYRYMFLNVIDSNTDLAYIDHMIALTDILTDLSYMREGASRGHVVVIDGGNVKLGHALKLNLTSANVLLQFSQIALPINLKEIHVVNVTRGLDKVYQLLKPFIGKELAKMIHIHTNVEDLRKHIPEKHIPVEIGGKGPSYRKLHDDMVKTLKDHTEYIRKDALDRTDETKRIGRSVDAGSLFGIEGTFKKLQID